MGEKYVNPFFFPELKKAFEIIETLNANYFYLTEVFIVPEDTKGEADHFFELNLKRKEKSTILFTNIYKAIFHQEHIIKYFQEHQNLNAILHCENKYHALSTLLGFMHDCNQMLIEQIDFVKYNIYCDNYTNDKNGLSKAIKDLKIMKNILNNYWLDPYHEVSLKIFPLINDAIANTENFNLESVTLLLNKILSVITDGKNFSYKKSE